MTEMDEDDECTKGSGYTEVVFINAGILYFKNSMVSPCAIGQPGEKQLCYFESSDTVRAEGEAREMVGAVLDVREDGKVQVELRDHRPVRVVKG